MKTKIGILLTLIYSASFSQEDFTQWAWYKNISINTTSSGANVAGTVTNFPLLLRLTSANADVFSQAATTGTDIRFTKANGTTRLRYQIERWNAGGQAAEIWVLMDTVYGNNSSQSVRMYWGKSGAADSSNGASVFQTANGFQGVWHMGGGSNTANEADASGNGFTATQSGSPTDTVGTIGRSRKVASFNGGSNAASQYLVVNNSAGSALNLTQGGPFSLSAWVTTGALSATAYRSIVGKSNNQYALKMGTLNTTLNGFEGHEYESSPIGWRAVIGTAPAINTWYHLTFVRNGAGPAGAESLYVNGTLATVTQTFTANTIARNAGYNLTIGALASGTVPGTTFSEGWNGVIDEVRISSAIRTSHWVKLDYENQKANQGMVALGQSTSNSPPPLPPIPQTPAQGAVNVPTSTTLTWLGLAGSLSYHVQLAIDSTFSLLVVDDSNLTPQSRAVGPLPVSLAFYWRVRAKGAGGYSAWSTRFRFTTASTAILPKDYALQRLNLKNGEALQFSLPRRAHVEIKLFNSQGRMVSKLLDESRDAGSYILPLSGGLGDAYYLLDFRAGDYHKTVKIHRP